LKNNFQFKLGEELSKGKPEYANCIYTADRDRDLYVVFFEYPYVGCCYYPISFVQECIDDGDWVVLEDVSLRN
jgi:hypothetical protein